MCARRNPDAHARLIGDFKTCDNVIPSWRGEYPKGLTSDEFLQASSVRSDLWGQGVRNSEIVEVLERLYGATGRASARASFVINTIRSSLGTQTHDSFRDLLVTHWATLNWHRSLQLLLSGWSLGEFGEIDIAAGDPAGPCLAAIEIGQDRDEQEVVESLQSYVSILEHCRSQNASLASLQIEGIIVARKATTSLMKMAKAANVGVYTADVSVSHDRQSAELQTRIRLKKCR